MAREISPNDSYLSRLLKYIPTEIVMVYISIDGVLRSAYSGNHSRLEMGLWVLAGVLTFLTPLWLWRVMGVKKFGHLFISTLSLLVWMFAIGGPFITFDWYHASLGAVALPLYTLLVPITMGSKYGR